MRTIQTVMATTSLLCTSLNQLRALILAAGTTVVVTAQADLIWPSLTQPSTPCPVTLIAFLGLLRAAHVADAVLLYIQQRSSSLAPRN